MFCASIRRVAQDYYAPRFERVSQTQQCLECSVMNYWAVTGIFRRSFVNRNLSKPRKTQLLRAVRSDTLDSGISKLPEG
jgi:hypothetical protein